jgi:hypothetical protein
MTACEQQSNQLHALARRAQACRPQPRGRFHAGFPKLFTHKSRPGALTLGAHLCYSALNRYWLEHF